MAAGGSAPELATSFVGTFQRSDVGFGTIVGSAVFNVLFVIGCCAIYTPAEFQPLPLTWWPLFRDCSYYVLTLVTLVIFMGDAKIEMHEAFIQFALYFGYVGLMSQSEKLRVWITSKLGQSTSKVADEGAAEAGKAEEGQAKRNDGIEGNDMNIDFKHPSTFRAGILQLLTSKTDITETAGVAFVAKLKGDVNQVWDEIDKDNNSKLELSELKAVLTMLGTKEEDQTDAALLALVKEMDRDGNGFISKEEFIIWYTKSEARIRNQTRALFDKFDSNGSGTIDKEEIRSLLHALGNHPTDKDILVAMVAMGAKEDKEQVTFPQFEGWYTHSLFWSKQKEAADSAAESQQSMWAGTMDGFKELKDPSVPFRAKAVFVGTLPLTLLFCLVPDCRPPGKEKLAVTTFLGSILMIAVLAILMVELATIFGDTLGIPSVVMGLTILAAGTSVPDLLTSVIVARQGEGDMAVSSSIGSNIFDVAFGLPVPWLVFSFVAAANECHCGVTVESGGLVQSLVVLLLMVAAIVATIAYFKWKMTQTLGYMMFFMYFAYVAYSLAITPEAEWVVAVCTVPFEFRPI
jgi:sodium/potassium/calcium exchanger 2